MTLLEEHRPLNEVAPPITSRSRTVQTPPKRVAEFFAGIGLMRMGLELAGWEVVWSNDIDPDKEAIYKGHFGERSYFMLGDVHALESTGLPDIELATASFPCTDLSLAGGRKGLAGSGSGAFWGFVSAIEGMQERQPKLIVLENVTGFLTSRQGRDFKDACLALNRLGYFVDAFVVDALHFVPQSRQRLFVVAHQSKSVEVAKTTPAFFEGSCRPRALTEFMVSNPEINWCPRALPELPTREQILPELLENLPSDSSIWWSPDRAQYLLEQMSERHRELADAMISGERVSYGTVFRRVRKGRSMAELRTDGIAGCLRTPKGGSGRQILFVAGRGKYAVRLLTPRECAFLMGATNYQLSPAISLNKALFGFGDAVCVPVVEWIAKYYLNPLWEDLHDVL